MNIIIKSKNIELTTPLREFIEKKISSLEKYFNLLQTADDPSLSPKAEAIVEISRTTFHHRKGDVFRAEVLLTFHRNSLRAGVSAPNLEIAVDAARDDLQRQITSFKGKIIDKSRK